MRAILKELLVGCLASGVAQDPETLVGPRDELRAITTRATDGTGDVQTEEFQLPQPDGASGRDSITLHAA
jgi:hypothetical protein